MSRFKMAVELKDRSCRASKQLKYGKLELVVDRIGCRVPGWSMSLIKMVVELKNRTCRASKHLWNSELERVDNQNGCGTMKQEHVVDQNN